MGLCPECLLAAGFSAAPETGAGATFDPPTPGELAPRFPDLEIVELLGRGGMGAVYKARQRRLNRIVALKILPPSLGDNLSFASRFEREAQALAKLHHPNIVTLYEFGESAGQFYFLMEYVEGATLRQLLKSGGLPPREALSVVMQVCDALQFAHDHRIVHRDIKPENILIDPRGSVKIADFGVVKILTGENGEATASATVAQDSGQTEAGKIVGTPQYMAPEQKAHPSDVDHRADVYALGVVFYEMLTGELPGQPIEVPSGKIGIDVRLDEIVLRALEREPARRYQEVREMRTSVETVAATPENGRPSETGAKGEVSQNHAISFVGPIGGAILGGGLIAALLLAFGHFTAALAIFASAISFAVVFVATRLLVASKGATNGNGDSANSHAIADRRVLAWIAACLLLILGGGVLFVAAGEDNFRRWYQSAMDDVPPHPIRAAVSESARLATAADVEETLRDAITARMRDAGYDPESVSVYVTPDLKEAECRLGKVSKGGLFSEPWNGSFELQPQEDNTWRVEGKGELQTLKFSVAVPIARLAGDSSLEKPDADQTRLVLGVAKELTLSAIDGNSPSRFLNLRTGEIMPPPADFKSWPDEELKQWMTQHPEVLILTRKGDRGWELITYVKPNQGTRFLKVDDHHWEEKSIDQEELIRLKTAPNSLPVAGAPQSEATSGGFVTRPAEWPSTFLFRSHAGITRLLRIEEITDLPGSARITIRTPQRRRKTEIVSGQEITETTPSTGLGDSLPAPANITARIRFSVEKQLSLVDIDQGDQFHLLNLNTGEFEPLPADFSKKSDKEQQQWVTESDMDLMLTRVDDKWGLFTNESKAVELVKVDGTLWQQEGIEAGELARLLNSPPMASKSFSGFLVYLLSRDSELPMTFLYRTAEGTAGLLRITGFAKNPRAAKLRLKIAEIQPSALKKSNRKIELENAIAERELVQERVEAGIASKLDLLLAEERVALLRSGEEGSADSDVAMISTRVRYARERLEMQQARFDAGIIAAAELEAARMDLERSEADLEQALGPLHPDSSKP